MTKQPRPSRKKSVKSAAKGSGKVVRSSKVRKLAEAANPVATDWVDNPYYDQAEGSMEVQWTRLIWPLIKDADFSNVIDLAAGHGRNTARLLQISGQVTAIDVNKSNIDFMSKRFKSDISESKLKLYKNSGVNFSRIDDGTITLIYCFDAMVHFDSDVVRAYISEFSRVLKPGGRAFVHHSNNSNNPAGSYRDHPGWRNFMNRTLFKHWVAKEGMEVIRSELVDWGMTMFVENDNGNTDAITLFRKP